MRWIQLLLFLVFLVVVLVFSVQNQEPIDLRFAGWRLQALPKALVLVSTYLLGMLSGWTVVGFFRRSLRRVERVSLNAP
jgi:uncharacterized integral membrane protein